MKKMLGMLGGVLLLACAVLGTQVNSASASYDRKSWHGVMDPSYLVGREYVIEKVYRVGGTINGDEAWNSSLEGTQFRFISPDEIGSAGWDAGVQAVVTKTAPGGFYKICSMENGKYVGDSHDPYVFVSSFYNAQEGNWGSFHPGAWWIRPGYGYYEVYLEMMGIC
ncbi:MAG: hypothetical protein K6F95_06435 [Selenomonas sp.]|uniref:hypothetical protein n=1 Tax=Selenomonas sp. TaxID=2053611 RepID=UPI0025E19E59|nr:hypothetical protein [Selenomonas sp.]MCR5757526.1 hypothetical protein [Selenomonas sp.]